MRINRVEINNFRGVRSLSVDEVAGDPLVIVSGANGAGKSVLLEAIYLATAGRRLGLPGDMVGSWGPTGSVEVEIALTEAERGLLTQAAQANMPHLGLTSTAPATVTTGIRASATQVEHDDGSDPWVQALLHYGWAAQLGFSQVDYLPADRHIPRGEVASVSQEVLSEGSREQMRQQTHQAAIARNPVSLAGIQPVLATLDYIDLLQQRSGAGGTGGEFEVLTGAFERATGKRIPRPTVDPTGISGSRLIVETPNGSEHGLDRLSSGEQAVLGLMFYARRLSAAGGVLLIDEPELHLHPALHSLLFEVLDTVADRSQIWTVTHSTRLVTSARASALLHVRPADRNGTNQAERVRDDQARLDLLDNLGIDPAEALQAELLLIVEGEEDRELLRRLLPIETGRAQFVVAGGAHNVMAVSWALHDGYSGRWIAIRDRDLLSAGEVAALQAKDAQLFVWPKREIENELLHDGLLVRALNAVGREVTHEQARHMIDAQFAKQRAQIEAGLVEARLRAANKIDVPGGQSIDQLRSYLQAVQAVAAGKLEQLEETVEAVASDIEMADMAARSCLIDGKRALAEIVRDTPFRGRTGLRDALIHASREDPTARPPGVEALRLTIMSEAAKRSA